MNGRGTRSPEGMATDPHMAMLLPEIRPPHRLNRPTVHSDRLLAASALPCLLCPRTPDGMCLVFVCPLGRPLGSSGPAPGQCML